MAKLLIILGLLLFIIGCSSSEDEPSDTTLQGAAVAEQAVVTGTCSENDGGDSPYKIGRLTFSYTDRLGKGKTDIHDDRCTGNTLTEYYCNKDTVGMKEVSCKDGCREGACGGCGNGVVDATETCSSCAVDVKCAAGELCAAGKCVRSAPPVELKGCTTSGWERGREYFLTKDVNVTKLPCFTIATDDVILDCKKHTLRAPTLKNVKENMIVVSWARNVTVKNCIIREAYGGISLQHAPISTVAGNMINVTGLGIGLFNYSTNVNVSNNTACEARLGMQCGPTSLGYGRGNWFTLIQSCKGGWPQLSRQYLKCGARAVDVSWK